MAVEVRWAMSHCDEESCWENFRRKKGEQVVLLEPLFLRRFYRVFHRTTRKI
jgi:hypothetical protein